MKYYAVKTGHTPGLFDNWPECQKSVQGYPGAVFQSFKSKEEAEAFLSDRDIWGEQVATDIEQGYLVAFCDGSFDRQLNKYSYGVVIINSDFTEIQLCGFGSNPKYIASNNIVGEVFGAINALDWAISNGCDKIKIYHDYEGLSKWISGEWKADAAVSIMYTSLYRSRFEGVIDVHFEKVTGHSHNPYNDKADALAKSALSDRKRMPIQGDHWFVLPYFKESDFDSLTELVSEEIPGTSIVKNTYGSKFVYTLEYEHKKVVISLFKSKNKKLLIQGENSLLFQVVVAIVTELDGNAKVDPILSSAYRTNIDSKKIDNSFNFFYPNLPTDYPENIKRLIRQALINLNYYVESEEYSQYAFPALRALEGHIKYLILKAGGTVGRSFSMFNKDSATGEYVYTAPLVDMGRKSQIEKCYNHYKSIRDTVFHFGDIIGTTDSTRMLEKKNEADDIIKKCFNLIGEI